MTAREASLPSSRSKPCGPVAWFTTVIGRFRAIAVGGETVERLVHPGEVLAPGAHEEERNVRREVVHRFTGAGVGESELLRGGRHSGRPVEIHRVTVEKHGTPRGRPGEQRRERRDDVGGAREDADTLAVDSEVRGMVAQVPQHGVNVGTRLTGGVYNRRDTRHGEESCPRRRPAHVPVETRRVGISHHDDGHRRLCAGLDVQRLVEVEHERPISRVQVWQVPPHRHGIHPIQPIDDELLRHLTD